MDDKLHKRQRGEQMLIEGVERVGKKSRVGSIDIGNTTSKFSGQGIQLTGQGDFNVYKGNVSITTTNAAPNTATGDCLRSLFITDPSDDRTALKRKKGNRATGTCEWILGTEEFTTWLCQDQPSNILWLYGNPGTGKSTMAIFLTETLSTILSATVGDTLAYFFCDSNFDTRKTATSIVRGLLLQLVQQHPQLLDYILPRYNERGAELFNSFDALWTIFMATAADQKIGQIYCIIDALDECDRASQKILLQQIQETFQSQDAPSNIHILVTSRPYSEIYEYLDEFANKDLVSFPQAKKDIDLCIEERVANLAKKKHYTDKVKQQVSEILRDKAEGTFLWVGLACEELKEIPSKDIVKVLQNMPKGLHSLYKTLLDAAQEESGTTIIRCILGLVAVCLRPLSVLELSEACQLYEEEDDIETRIQYTRDQIASCRLMVVVQEEKVLLLHQSVKDYLVGVGSDYFIDVLKAHANIAYRCVHLLIEEFRGREQSSIPFFSYAVQAWPDHARMAQSKFEVRESEAEFFQINSPSREHWLTTFHDRARYWTINDIPNALDMWTYDAPPRNMSILHIAGRWGIASLVDYITNRCSPESTPKMPTSFVDLDCVDSSNPTPIELAVLWGFVSVIYKLLCLGAEVDESVVTAAARNMTNGGEVMALLLDHRGDQIIITEGIIKAAARNPNTEVMELFLDRRGDHITITEDIIKAAVENNNTKIMALLLDRLGDQIIITERIVKAAARNSNKELMELIFDQRGDQIAITEDIVKAAAENYNKELMVLLLDRRGDQITITEDIIKAAAGNISYKVMALLLDRRGDQITITEDIVKAAARNISYTVMALLLHRRGDQITITEDIVKAALGSPNEESQPFSHRIRDQMVDEEDSSGDTGKYCGKAIIELLLDWRGDQIIVTEGIVKAAVRNSNEQLIALLLDRRGSQIIITEDIVKAAARNYNNKVMALLLDRRGDQIAITENIIKAAARNKYKSKEIITLLFERRGNQITITEDIIQVAVGEGVSTEILVLLLNQYGGQIAITENILKVAAGNTWTAMEAMTLLLNRYGDQIIPTENVVKAAAGNWNTGTEVMTLLFDWKEDQITITEDIMKAAAGNVNDGKEIITLLLDRCGEQIAITEDIVKTAAGNETNGKEIITLLLDHCGEQIAITEDIVKVAAGNETNGKEIITLILDRFGEQITITEDVIKAAATCGQDDVLNILSQRNLIISEWDKWKHISKFYNAAFDGDIQTIQQLLDQGVNPNFRYISGRTPLWISVVRGHEEVVKILAHRRDVDINSRSNTGETPLFAASKLDLEQMANILIEAGADPQIENEYGDTAVAIARRFGHDRIVEIIKRVA